jgi:dephospho-CoA kinase
MKRVLLTGISGAGKSTVTEALAALGYNAVDVDVPEYSEVVSVAEDELTGLGDGKDWVWRAERIQALLDADDAPLLFLSGTSPNQGRFYDQLDAIVLLTAPAAVIVQRLATRTTNSFGKRPDEVGRVLALQETIEPLLREGATHVIDTGAPLNEVVERILRIVAELS